MIRFPQNLNFAARRTVQPCQRAKQSGLPRPVIAKDCVQFPRPELCGDAAQSRKASKLFNKTSDRDNRRRGRTCRDWAVRKPLIRSCHSDNASEDTVESQINFERRSPKAHPPSSCSWSAPQRQALRQAVPEQEHISMHIWPAAAWHEIPHLDQSCLLPALASHP